MKMTKNKIRQAQINALIARLQSGKPLTAAQMDFLNQEFPKVSDAPSPEGVASDDDTAKNWNDLAKRLGVHRQTISYHKSRVGSPAGLSVSEWRNYLELHGKMPTAAKLASGKSNSAERDRVYADVAFSILFDVISNALPGSIRLALSLSGVKVSPRRADEVAFSVWMQLAAAYQVFIENRKEYDAQGPFDPCDDEGNCEYPDAIRSLAQRLQKQIPIKPTTEN